MKSSEHSLLSDYFAHYGSLEPDPLCPELYAWNTRDFGGLWKRSLALDGNAHVPYWGIVWPGGRALARYILDNKKLFRKKRVMDMGTGSGITASAAALCGATVTGFDIDPAALALSEMTAVKNGVQCEFRQSGAGEISDAELSSYDIIIAGDIFNSAGFAGEMISLARRGLCAGMQNYFSDAGRSHRPRSGVRMLEKITVPVFLEIEGVRTREVKIFSIYE